MAQKNKKSLAGPQFSGVFQKTEQEPEKAAPPGKVYSMVFQPEQIFEIDNVLLAFRRKTGRSVSRSELFRGILQDVLKQISPEVEGWEQEIERLIDA